MERRRPIQVWWIVAAGALVVLGVLLAIWLGGGGGSDTARTTDTTLTRPVDVLPPEDQPPGTQPAPVNPQTPSAEPTETVAPEQGRRDDEPLVAPQGGEQTTP